MLVQLSNWYGTKYNQPILTRDGIYADYYCKSGGEDRLCEYYFDQVGVQPVKHTEYNGMFIRLYPASIENLEKFLLLDIPDEAKQEAARLLHERRDLIPMMLDSFYVQRAASKNVDKATPLHRVPHDYVVRNRSCKVTKTSHVEVFTPTTITKVAKAKAFRAVTNKVTRQAPLNVADKAMIKLGMKPKPRFETVDVKTVQCTPIELPFHRREVIKTTREFEYSTLEMRESAEKEPVLQEWYKYASSKKPFSQQMIAAEFMYRISRWCVWYTMRTGKTLSSIMAAKRLLREGKIQRVIFVCPLNILWATWVKELLAEGLEPTILEGTEDQDTAAAYDGSKVYLLNYERLAVRLEILQNAWDPSTTMVVADETGAIKTADSNRSRAMHEFCKPMARVALLNGSPMEEGPHHLWSQMRCVDPEGTWFPLDYVEYCRKYLVEYRIGKYTARDMRVFTRLVEGTSIRYTAAESDQFNGKDSQIRYIRIKATRHQVTQSVNAALGFMRDEKDGSVKNTNSHVLSVMNQLREICCGTDKWKEGGVYHRNNHSVDPKLAWIICYLLTTTDPVVVFTEFNWFEDQLKQLLDEHEISWVSTREKGKQTTLYRLTEDAAVQLWSRHYNQVHQYVLDRHTQDGDEAEYPPVIEDALTFRYHPIVVEWFQANEPASVESYTGWSNGRKLDSRERAAAIETFNTGGARCLIVKGREGRGFAANRVEAMANGIGEWPSIIFTAPGWTLADYEQAKARCMTSDPKTGQSVCTQIFALSIASSIEDKMYNALREKKGFADVALKDCDRVGAQAFIDDLVDCMGNDGDFDGEDMAARIVCGVNPYANLTRTLIPNKIMSKYGIKKAYLQDFLAENEEVRKAYDYLLSMVKQ